MRRVVILLLSLLSAVTISAQGSMDVKTFTLSNGMEVWINEDHSLPKAYGAVVVKAGARDCPGTGIAHYFEHIMFKGTEKIGTLDYAAEKPYLDSIALLYDRLSEAPMVERATIQKEINRLNIAASRYAVPNEFNNLIMACGGSHLNAYTSNDVTVYHNEFVSAYFEQWAELNSERLIDPVFRLFQGELETVYEEKNRSESNEMSAFAQMLSSEGYKGSPYQYPIIGTTENLKTPRLSQMADFFKKFYVAGNMGLMLTGDIDAKTALPVLERTFGRIRSGAVERSVISKLEPFEGREVVRALVKMPIVKISALCFRGPSKKDADSLPMSLMAFMLNNSEGIGLLDKLTTDKKILAAICMFPDLAFEEAGLFPILIMPKLLFQRNQKAEAKVFAVLDQIKRGDFSEEFFESCKMTYKKHLITQIETLSGRMNEMINAYSQGRTWKETLREIEAIDSLTKDDMLALANKYFTDNCLIIRKKYGDPEKDNLQKPPYDKITPNNDASSAYADAFRAEAEKVELPRIYLDFEKDARQTDIIPLVHLYSIDNPLNDVFRLTLEYPVGTLEYPALERVASYLTLLGTKSMDYEEHRSKLQTLGGSLSITAERNKFTIRTTGFDKYFEETVALVFDLLQNPAGDKSKLSILKESELSDRIMRKRDLSELDNALVQYVVYGDGSSYLQDKGKLDVDTILSLLKEVQKFECDIHYSGSLPDEKIVPTLKGWMTPEIERKAHPYYFVQDVVFKEGPTVYCIPKKKSAQTRIEALVQSDQLADIPTRYTSTIVGDYFGGGMSSVLFQEIREFRSLAYSTNATIMKPYYCEGGDIQSYLRAFVGTQGDKTIDAMSVLDTLIHHLPISEERFLTTQKKMWSDIIANYPSFRSLSIEIATNRRAGFSSDPTVVDYQVLEQIKIDDLDAFWKRHVSNHNIIWTVVGDPDKIGIENLQKFGTVIQLKPGDVIK